MSRKKNETTIPTDYVRFFPMDWNGNNITWSNNATVTNATWTTSSFSYIKQQLSWGASTTFTYSSFTYTNSYLIKNWNVIKNSWEVWTTALSWVNWNTYQWLIFFNRTLTTWEELAITQYAKRKLWPTNTLLSWEFPLYSLPNLENWKVLEISKPVNVLTYYDQSWNWNNWTSTSVTDSTNGKYNVMNFNWIASNINIPDNTNIRLTWNYTISFWLKRSNTTSTQRIINKDNANDFSWWYSIYIDTVINSTHNNWTNKNWNTWYTPTIWKWENIVLTFDWSTRRIYVNWVLKNSLATSWNITWEATNNLFIWSYWASTPLWQYLQADLTLPKLYNRALSDTEILQDYYAHKIV